jgi:UDP-N-acetylglucosamine 2-epimerase (non-hydrolysing)
MILLVYGTRPEFIKIKPLIAEMSKRGLPFKTLFTGQHKNLTSYEATYHIELNDDGSNRLDSIVKGCMSLPNEWFEGISHVLVQGDTTSAMGMALTAMHRQIKVIHLEAGLRTYDKKNPFPEENNRRIIATIANIHLCPTEHNVNNLMMEGIHQNTFVVGNTGLDNLVNIDNNSKPKNLVLITLHRRENHEILDKWFKAINFFAKNYPMYVFMLPLHPNPNVRKHSHLLTNVMVVPPLEHDLLLEALLKSKLVITDSGGLQEECSFFKKKCLVCRKTTERPEALNETSFLIKSPDDLYTYFDSHLATYDNVPSTPSPFGDGHASEKICDIFQKLIYV